MINVYFDGACEPNPNGVCTWGFIVQDGEKLLREDSGVFTPQSDDKRTTNNIAEYCGLIKALLWLKNAEIIDHGIIVRGDSQLVIKQMSGEWHIGDGAYKRFADHAAKIKAYFPMIAFEWIPREENLRADALTKRELLKRGVTPIDYAKKYKRKRA